MGTGADSGGTKLVLPATIFRKAHSDRAQTKHHPQTSNNSDHSRDHCQSLAFLQCHKPLPATNNKNFTMFSELDLVLWRLRDTNNKHKNNKNAPAEGQVAWQQKKRIMPSSFAQSHSSKFFFPAPLGRSLYGSPWVLQIRIFRYHF